MRTLRLVKKLIFIAVIICAFAYLYNLYTKETPEGLPRTQKTPDITEKPAVPEGYEDVKQETEPAGLDEEQKILSFDMTGYTKEGQKKWDIKGKSADIVSESVILEDIKANAYTDDRTVALTADSGDYNKKDSSVRLENNVVVTTSDGVRLEAEWFKWSSETNKITTDSFVQVAKDNLYASGYGALASTKDKEVRLNKDIVVKQDEMTISCGGPLIIDYDNNKASFYDKVEITEPRGELLADRLDVFFNPDSRKIESVTAEGNVELRRNQDVAKGQKIIYTIASGEAILTGNPEVVIYSKEDIGNALTGD